MGPGNEFSNNPNSRLAPYVQSFLADQFAFRLQYLKTDLESIFHCTNRVYEQLKAVYGDQVTILKPEYFLLIKLTDSFESLQQSEQTSDNSDRYIAYSVTLISDISIFLDYMAGTTNNLVDFLNRNQVTITQISISFDGVTNNLEPMDQSDLFDRLDENLEAIRFMERRVNSYLYNPKAEATEVNLPTVLATLNLNRISYPNLNSNFDHPSFLLRPGDLEFVILRLSETCTEFNDANRIEDKNIQFVFNQHIIDGSYSFWFEIKATTDTIRSLGTLWIDEQKSLSQFEAFVRNLGGEVTFFHDQKFKILVTLPTSGRADTQDVQRAKRYLSIIPPDSFLM